MPSEVRLPGVTVSLIKDTNGNGTWEPGEPIYLSTDITDANGQYLFSEVPAGRWSGLPGLGERHQRSIGRSGTCCTIQMELVTPNISTVTEPDRCR